MHHDSVEHSGLVKAWQKDPANKNAGTAGDDRAPAWTWQGYTYHDGANVCMAADNVMACLRQAGAQVRIKGNSTFKQLTQSGMFITTEFCQFLSDGKSVSVKSLNAMKNLSFEKQADKCRELGFRLFVKRARVGTSKHVRVRPRFDKWSLTGNLQIEAKELTPEALELIFKLAGKVGLGDWRPGCRTPGPFGMFTSKLTFQ